MPTQLILRSSTVIIVMLIVVVLLVAVTVVLFGVTVIESVGSIGVIVIVVPFKLII